MAMVTGAKKVFELIARGLPALVCCKDMLVLAPTEGILRGFLLEMTGEKDMLYLWRVVTPLHRPMRDPILNYSQRINNGEKVFIDRSDYRRSADAIHAIISRHIEYLKGIRSQEDFLGHIAWMTGNSSFHFRYDLALSYFCTGRMEEAKGILRLLAMELDEPEKLRDEKMFKGMKQFNDDVRLAALLAQGDPLQLADLIKRWEMQNIDTLALRPSLSAKGCLLSR